MKVAVCGGWHDETGDWSIAHQETLEKACRQIGRKIVSLGHTLVVGEDKPNSADFWAVRGVVDEPDSSFKRPCITILRPKDNSFPFKDERSKDQSLFTTRPSIDTGWNITKILQVREADAVVVVGGAEHAYQAGLTAVLCRKPVVPVGWFGGAGKQLINVLTISRSLWPGELPSDDDLGSLHNEWGPFVLNKLTELLGLSRKPRILIIHGHTDERLKLKNFLQSDELKLPDPVILEDEEKTGEILPLKLEQWASMCDGAIAVATPDDVGGLATTLPAGSSLVRRVGDLPGDFPLAIRARQNVWMEVGWFWGRLGRERFLLLYQENVELPSDLSGMLQQPYKMDPLEKSEAIRRFIRELEASTPRSFSATGG